MNSPRTPFDSLKPLAGRALEIALNRLLALDPDTQADLSRLEGRRIALALEAPALALEISVDNGQLKVGPAQAQEADLGIRASLAGALSQLPFLRAANATPVGKVRINGDAELAIWVISSANGPDTELAGVLPAQAGKFNSYVAGILTTSNQKEAAKALSSFISSRASLAIMKSKGFNPP